MIIDHIESIKFYCLLSDNDQNWSDQNWGEGRVCISLIGTELIPSIQITHVQSIVFFFCHQLLRKLSEREHIVGLVLYSRRLSDNFREHVADWTLISGKYYGQICNHELFNYNTAGLQGLSVLHWKKLVVWNVLKTLESWWIEWY